MLILPCFSILIVTFVHCEIITFLKETNVTCCVTGSSVNSPIYLNPPTLSGFHRNRKDVGPWFHDDWNVTKSTEYSFLPVRDKRWTDFTIFESSDGFAFITRSLSFSLFTDRNVILQLHDREFKGDKILNQAVHSVSESKNNQRWLHYSLLRLDDELQLYSDYKMIQQLHLGFDLHWLYIKGADSDVTFSKIHHFDIRVSHNVTGDQESGVYVEFKDNLCISAYVSVDENCYLEVALLESNNRTTNITTLGFNKAKFKSWKQIVVRAEAPGLAKLSFFRKHMFQDVTEGFWAIDDLRFCDSSIDTYQTQVETPGEYNCKALHEVAENPVQLDPCDEPGYLGFNCNISCIEALGESYSNCEHHKICQGGSPCFCSWGFQGSSCEKTCNTGTWGLFCRNQCLSNYSNCNPATGKYLTQNNTSSKLSQDIAEVSGDELPVSLSVTWKKIRLQLPDQLPEIKTPITYNLKCVCISKWCQNIIVLENNFTVSSNDKRHFVHFQNLTPFTDYQPTVVATRNDKKVERVYNIVGVEPLAVSVFRDLKVYSSAATRLSVAFQCSRRGAIFEIWYQTFDSVSPPNSSTNVTPCKLRRGWWCGTIDNLQSDTFYSLAVATLTEPWEVSKKFTGHTAQKASEAPEDLRIEYSSSNDIKLSWDFPFVSNGPLEYFMLEVEDGNTKKTQKINIEEERKTYNITIPLKLSVQHEISVRGVNQFDGNKAVVKVTLFRSENKLTVIETCSSECHLMIQKPAEIYTENSFSKHMVLIADNCENVETERIIATAKKLPEMTKINEELMIFPDLEKEGETYFQVAIGKEAILSKNKNLSICLIDVDNKSTYLIANSYDGYSRRLVYTIWGAAATVIIVIIIVGVIVYRCDHKKKKKRNLSVHAVEAIEVECLVEKPKAQEERNTIHIKDLENYIRMGIADSNEIVNQFRSLPHVKSKTSRVALQHKNVNKNKDKRNVPYDCTRVILQGMEGMGGDDYINANYIDGLNRPKAYIATQGPKFSTMRDFWRMIWLEHVETIVMVTSFMEDKKRKCAEYWPQQVNTLFECGAMTIKLINEEVYEHYDCRTFEVYYIRYRRTVRHLSLKWNPDSSTPLYANRMVPLARRIREIYKSSSTPIVVHCSSGSNRTGTVILTDLALQRAETENVVDFFGLLKRLREQRPNMVASEKQYLLVHLIVLECLAEAESPFKNTIRENLSLLKEQLLFLDGVCWHDSLVRSWKGTPDETYVDVDRISVDGYGRSGKFLVAHQPPQSTICLTEFWKHIVQEKISVVVFLSKPKYRVETSLWPLKFASTEGVTVIKEINRLKTAHYTLNELLLRCEGEPKQILYEERIFFFQCHVRSRVSTTELLNIVTDVNKFPEGQAPILIGINKESDDSCLYLCLSYIIEKHQQELEFDVYNAVRTVRRSGLNFVDTTAQMEFLYRAVLEYSQTFDSYTNVE